MQYIQNIGYYVTLKRNKLSSHQKTQRKHKCILLKERSQSEKFLLYDPKEKYGGKQ